MFISIIIPHWNGIDVLSECIDSLKQSTYQDKEIIIVDNASSDGSQAWIKEHHPDIILVENDKNYGLAKNILKSTSPVPNGTVVPPIFLSLM